MKLNGNVYHVNKQLSLEEGSMRYETTDEDSNSTDDRESNRCNLCLQLMKVILYLELILFIGWIGCVFISNYYQIYNHNGLDEPYGTSEWSQDPDSLSMMDSNSVSPDAIKWSPEQNDTKTTTAKSQTHAESANKKNILFSQLETTTATNVIEPNDTDVESMLLSPWLESLTVLKNTWDDNCSKLNSSEDKFDWDTSSNEKSALNANSDGASTIENRFGTVDQDDKIDINFLLMLPPWYNAVFTSDYLDEIVHSDEDSFHADGIPDGTFVFVNPDLIEHHRSRQARSTIGQEEDSSSSSSSEEAITKYSEPHLSNSEANEDDQCPMILDDEDNVIDEPKDVVNYISKNWVRWLEDTDIPECEKPKVVKTVTVDKCGKFVINCVIEEKTPMNHHRETRSLEKDNATEAYCKQLVAALQEDFEAWRTKLVIGESSDPMVENLYQNVGKHIFALTVKEIVERTSRGQDKTNEEWLTSVITMRNNISELIDSKYRNLLTDSSELTLEMAADLGKIVGTAVDIYMNCRDVLLVAPQAQILTMLIEQERCLQGSERIRTMENRFAAEIVPGESTNWNVMTVRQRFKANVMLLIIRMAKDENHGDASVPTGSINVKDKQWTSYMLGLKQEIATFAEDPALRKQLEDTVSPTQEQTNQLREIAEYYMRRHVQCSLLTLFGLIGEFNDVALHNNRSARSTDSKWETAYIETFKIYQNEKNSRRKRAVVAQELPTPTIVTCTLEDDDIQFDQERQERLNRYKQFVALNTTDLRELFLNAFEKELNGTSSAEKSDETPTRLYMHYMHTIDVFVGNSSSSLRDEGYNLLRDIVLELKYLDDNETAREGYHIDALMQNWTGCLIHIPDNYTAETVLMAVIKAGEAMNLHYSGVEDGKNCGDEFTPVYGTFTYVGEEPEKSIVRRWRHIFRGIVRLYFRINNPEALPKLHCTSNKEKSQTKKTNVETVINRLGKRSIGYPIRKSDNSVNIDEKDFENEDNTPLAKVNPDVVAESRNFDLSQNTFFDKMETLSSHIDRLHEMYQKYNELNDDYVSKEFPDDMPYKY